MPRSSLREELTSRLHEYLAIAELHSPEEYPLDVKSVAVALNVSRTTVYKYALDEDITAASQRQWERAYNSGRRTKRSMLEEIISELKARLHLAEERIKQLIARLAMVEANAARLGINPEDLYRPILKPIRDVSHAGSNISGGKKRWPQQN
jgi:hypothetical protein